jgi:cell wall-associated NlpC family hydrolase
VAGEFNSDAGSKTKMLNDVFSLLQKISPEFDKIDNRSKSIGSNIKNWLGGLGGVGGAGGASSPGMAIANAQGTYSTGFGSGGAGAANLVGSIAGAGISAAVGVAGSLATAMPTVQQAVSSQLLTSQAKFSGMQGNVNATVKSLMGMGTTSSSTDVQQAIALGTQNGVLPGLPGYNSQIMPGTMQLSNLTGSATSAMQATAALNTGQSVNTLRMMGINVRGSNGAERNPAAIFRDIYNFAVQQSGGRLNASNIAIALQPGNGLANLLDAAAAGDQNLRQSLQTAALQFSKGGDLTKASLTQTGQLTAAVNSQSTLNQKQFGLLAASQTPEAAGFVEANRLLGKATDALTKLVSSNAVAAAALKQLAKGETLLNNPVGKGGAGALASIAGFGIKALGAIGGFIAGEVVDPFGGGIVGAGLGYTGASSLVGGSGLGQKSSAGLGQGASVSPQTSSIQSTGAANLVISTGLSLQGVPYSWGGGSIGGPTTGTNQGNGTVGFDCSSFVQYAFARVGVMLPRTTYAQINCGTAITPTDAQPGDLLFFGNPQSPDHVAIYIGNNRMVEAPHTGDVIKTTSINLKSVSAARRVINGATGTAINSNLLKGHRSPTTMAGNLSGLLKGMTGTTFSGGSLNMNDLLGYDPNQAMTGGVSSGGGGLGLGSDSSSSSTAANMAQSYLYFNAKTGILESSAPGSGISHNYGGVTINIPVPHGQQLDEKKLATLIKKELLSINIQSKVATK